MEININSENDLLRKYIILIINSLKNSVNYNKISNNHESFSSFKDYIFSRYLDKLTSQAANYIRIDWILNTLNFKELDEFINEENKNLDEESKIELLSSILRPLTEIYLDLKCIEINETNFKLDVENSCQLLYYDSVTEFYQLKLSISKEIYDCEPKYFKLWSETNKGELNTIKKELSSLDILLLKNVRNKYKGILKHYGKTERMILGFDYLTHYAVLSKKTHFSYTNIPYTNISAKTYLIWCLLYFLMIYNSIMNLLQKKDDTYIGLKPVIEQFVASSSVRENNIYEVDSIVLMEFGIAQIVEIKDFTYKVCYKLSNCFKVGELDAIPKIFIIGKIEKSMFEATLTKYNVNSYNKIIAEEYEKLYKELLVYCLPQYEKYI